MKEIYLICGVSGSGKSWVCNQLKDSILYINNDKVSNAEQLISEAVVPILYEKTTLISTFLKNQTREVIPVFIIGDFLQVKQQLIKRGGKITKGLYKRWKRMKVLNEKHGAFSGSSHEVLNFLKESFSEKKQHDIYKVTSPTNKIYIGKTNQGLEKRKYDHIWEAKNNKGDSYFKRAIRKHGDNLVWEVIETSQNGHRANAREKYWINFYKSTDKDKGYNLTYGGDGGIRTPEAEAKRIAAIKKAYECPKLREKMRLSSAEMWKDDALKAKITEGIKKTRGTDKSRAKTAEITTNQWQNEEYRKANAAGRKEYWSKPENKDKFSAAQRIRSAKRFEAIDKATGKVVGTYDNQVVASDALGVLRNGISRVLNGHLKHYKGYIFRFI